MSDDWFFQNHVQSRKQKLLGACDHPGLVYEPYGQDQKSLTPAEESDAKTVAGIFEEAPGLRKDYQDTIRVAHFRGRGESDDGIASRLKLPLAFIKSCKDPDVLTLP